MSRDEVMNWLKEYKTKGTPESSRALLQYAEPIMRTAIYSFANGDKRYRIQAAKLALDAAKSYDPSHGTDLKTHMYNHLQRLNRISASRSNMVHIPENVSALFTVIEKGRADYEDRFDRSPSDTELADFLHMPVKTINRVDKYRQPVSESMTYTPEGDDTLGFKATKDNDYLEYLYRSSDPTDQKIIEYGTGYNGNKMLSGKDIAAKLKITPAAVSQRMNRLSNKMSEIRGLV